MEALLSKYRQEAEAKTLALEKAGKELRDVRAESASAAAIATARISELERAAAAALAAARADSADREAEHERALRDLRERWVNDVANMERQARSCTHARARPCDAGYCALNCAAPLCSAVGDARQG
jgi:hypothetical protein